MKAIPTTEAKAAAMQSAFDARHLDSRRKRALDAIRRGPKRRVCKELELEAHPDATADEMNEKINSLYQAGDNEKRELIVNALEAHAYGSNQLTRQ